MVVDALTLELFPKVAEVRHLKRFSSFSAEVFACFFKIFLLKYSFKTTIMF